MATAEEVLRIARAEIGTSEYPPGSNRVKYNTDFYSYEVEGDNYPWCAVWTWWLFRRARAPELFYGGGKCAGCTTLMWYHRDRGEFVTGDYRPGDLLLYNWYGGTARGELDADHIGILESISDIGTYTAIEGNTSLTSNDNGGCVMRRERFDRDIIGAIRPRYDVEEDEDMTPEKLAELLPEAFAILAQSEPDEWAEKALEYCKDKGYMVGDEHGNQQPKKPLLRQEAAQLIMNLTDK